MSESNIIKLAHVCMRATHAQSCANDAYLLTGLPSCTLSQTTIKQIAISLLKSHVYVCNRPAFTTSGTGIETF